MGDLSIEFAFKLKVDVDDSDHISTKRCWPDWRRNYELGAIWDINWRVQLAFTQISTVHGPNKLKNRAYH